MWAYFSAGVLVTGLVAMVGAQIAIALYAFTGNPLKGFLCFLVPFYVFVYARRHPVSPWFMRCWFMGIALFIVGGVLAS